MLSEARAEDTSDDLALIGSQHQGLVLCKVERGADRGIWYCTARMTAPGLVAEKSRISAHYSLVFDDLIEYFDGLATAWRGWSETRVYESLEGDLRLVATHLGSRVALAVTLRQPSFDEGWTVSAVVELEAGEQLAKAAADVKLLLSR